MLFECDATSFQLEMAHKAKAIRQRLLTPPNSVQDRPLSLKKQTYGINGIQARKLAQEALERLAEKRKAEAEARWQKIYAQQQAIIEGIAKVENRDWLIVNGKNPRENKFPPYFLSHVKQIVARKFLLTTLDLESPRRSHDIVIPRHVAQYLCKILTPKSLPEIGRVFGGMDHSSVFNSVRKMPDRMRKDAWLCQTVVELQARLEFDLARWRAGWQKNLLFLDDHVQSAP